MRMEALRASAQKEWELIRADFPLWGKDDARRWALSRIPPMLFSPTLGLCLRRTVLEDPNWWETYAPGAGPILFKSGRDEFDRHLKGKLLLDLAHNIELPFRVILMALDHASQVSDFSAVYNSLLRENKPYLRNVPSDWRGTLDLIRLSRNTVHNSWFHYPKNQKNQMVIFKGTSYAFIVGKQLDFISWNLLHDLSEDALRIIVAVVRDPNVLALQAVQDAGAGEPID